VDGVVVADAEQHTVVDVGGSVVLPLLDVVGVAAAYCGSAAGEDAVLVAGLEGSA
jgi:hypothetical protein